MIVRLIALSLLWICSSGVWARAIIDVFGAEPNESQFILSHYGKQVEQIMLGLSAEQAHLQPGQPLPKKIQQLVAARARLIEQIKRSRGYLFVDFNEVIYPDKSDHYITIDVVTKNHPERLRWVHDEHYPPVARTTQPDVLDKMTEYSHLSAYIMQTEPGATKDINCPVYHCFMGFNHPQLKPYLSVFNDSVAHEKDFILQALNTESDPTRRASAVFLVGHFTNPQEIVDVLLPHITDADSTVRNNSMRVIATTLMKANNLTVDAKPFLELLTSPYLTDRNKALFVLYDLTSSVKAKKQFIQMGSNLLALLALKQPNQHDTAYLILKQLSGKDFGATNLTAWQHWLTAQQAKR